MMKVIPLDGCTLTVRDLESRRLRLRRPRNISRHLPEALKALAKLRHKLVESLGLDRVFDFVVKPVAAETALDDGHRERATVGAHDGFKRLLPSLGDDLARDDLAVRIFLLELIGKELGEIFEIVVAMRVCQHQQIVRPDTRGGPLAKSSAISLGASAGCQPCGRSSAKRYSR